MSGTSYLGYMGPGSLSGAGNAQRFAIRRRTARMSTATLVQVVTAPYDIGGNAIEPGSPVVIGYVDVQPLINQLDGLGNSMPHAVVYHASYFRYQGGAGAVIIDPEVGDIGKFVVAERDTSLVKATNQQSNPGSRRRHSKADGTYFGCPQGSTAPQSYVTFPANGIIIRDASGNVIALVSDTNINPPTVTGSPAQSIAMTSDGVTITDRNGNVVAMTSSGITLTSPTLVTIVAPTTEVKVNPGDTTYYVQTTGGTSDSLKASV